MPWTIYRYILRDLLKLLAITTGVLVAVISFAAAIKPLADGLLTATSLMKFVGYTSPTMLVFALPFAGAFASTLVFLRLASDNEFTAMSASGMSYFTIFTPVAALGLVLTVGLFLLSNFVIPGFYRAAAQTVQHDLMSVLVTRLNQHRPFEMKNYVLHADSAEEPPLTPAVLAQVPGEVKPSQWVKLKGVAVGRIDDQNRLRGDVTAQRANVLVFRTPTRSWVTIRLRNVMRFDDATGDLGHSSVADIGPVALPSPLKDSPEYLSWGQLRSLRDKPARYQEVADLKEKLADAVAAEQLRENLLAGLGQKGAGGRVVLQGPHPEERFVLAAPRVRRRDEALRVTSRGRRPVAVEAYIGQHPTRRFTARAATLEVERTPGAAEPSVLVTLEKTKVFRAGESRPSTERTSLILPRMRWPGSVLNINVDELNTYQTLALAHNVYGNAGPVRQVYHRLLRLLGKLDHRIKAQLHERAASALACLLLLLLGAILSTWLQGQMSLVVYFWSFALAILTVIIINAGTNLAGNIDFPLAAGLAVLWSGNVLLAVVLAAVYCRIARN